MKEKPVLWQWLDTVQVRKKVPDCFIKSDWSPLYKKPQTKPLSDEEIYNCMNEILPTIMNNISNNDLVNFARAIEERHGIK